MISFLFVMFVLMFVFWFGFKITGALLATFIWLFIEIPLALLTFLLGLVFCCTIILLPLGMGCFKLGSRLLMPAIL